MGFEIHILRADYADSRARICKPFKEPRNRFPTWRVRKTALSDVPARQATLAGLIDSLESISGLLKRLQIRAQKWQKHELPTKRFN